MERILKNYSSSPEQKAQNKTQNRSHDISSYHIFLGILFGLISLVGIVGNTLVLFVVKKKRVMRTTANLLLANLAMADLLSLLGLLPSLVQSYFKDMDIQVGRYICVFMTAGNLCVVALAVSVITLAILAYERYMALIKPMREQWRLNEDNVTYAIVSTWTVSIALAIPFFFRTTYDEIHQNCTQTWASLMEQAIYLGSLLTFLFIVPYLVIMFCYFSIIKGIYFSNEICPMDTGNNEADARSKKRVVEVLLMVTLCFTVCVGTFALVNTLKEIGIVQNDSFAYHLATVLLFVNSSVNPVIYAFRSSSYKQAFREISNRGVAVQS